MCATLDELRGHLRRLRGTAESVAEPLGLGVVAAGTVPLVDLDGDDISAGARYERMQHEYQLLVREQHICGAQVHVDVPDRDVAVQVVRRVAPYLPTLLAISASSPYWRGQRHRLRQLPQHGLVALADRGAARPRRDRRRLRRDGRTS